MDKLDITEINYAKDMIKKGERDGRWWLTPVILATQEAEIRRIMVRSQPEQIFVRPYLEKYPT
jgi:hypothetical protein